MARTNIEWVRCSDGSRGQTWNPIAGCSLASRGCTNCYAMQMARRHELMSTAQDRVSPYEGLTRLVNDKAVWTGEVRLVELALKLPLRRRKPTTWFVNSMSDLFHESVPDAWIDRVFAVMALAHWHTFQVLTKRSARMREYLNGGWQKRAKQISDDMADAGEIDGDHVITALPKTLRNVWLGVSAEDQARADERVPDLLATPAAIRFVSAEPLLSGINFAQVHHYTSYGADVWNALTGFRGHPGGGSSDNPHLDWVIVGGESGRNARPMHPDWARSIRDQCAAAGTAFFFKQWGAWKPISEMSEAETDALYEPVPAGQPDDFTRRCRVATTAMNFAGDERPSEAFRRIEGSVGYQFFKLGKGRAGRTLDGLVHEGGWA